MSAKHVDSKNKENKENKENKDYRSRHGANISCYRRGEAHYVYLQWVEPDDGGEGYYIEHVYTVGEEGVTLELLDYLQATDNGEVQDQKDQKRIVEKMAETMSTFAKSPEEEICSEEEEQSVLSREFDEKVKPHLSNDQMNLIYDRYGMDKSLEQIAAESSVKDDGSHITQQAVSKKLNRIFAKVRKYMPQE